MLYHEALHLDLGRVLLLYGMVNESLLLQSTRKLWNPLFLPRLGLGIQDFVSFSGACALFCGGHGCRCICPFLEKGVVRIVHENSLLHIDYSGRNAPVSNYIIEPRFDILHCAAAGPWDDPSGRCASSE